MKLIALATGFYKGNRVKAGQSFEFDGEKAPKWAAREGEVTIRATGKPVRGDTKPLAAAKAAAKKAAGQAESELA